MIDYDARSWLSIVSSLRGSVLPRLLGRILVAGIVGGAAAWAYQERGFKLAAVAHTLIGVALGLLLVFRTNASYDRFWEGRKLLGMMVNRARDLARQIRTFVDDRDTAVELRRWVAAMIALIMQMLRRETDLEPLAHLLPEDERKRLEPFSPRHTIAAEWISSRLRALADAGKLSEHRLQLMDANLTSLIDQLGGAERILKTPVPFAYAQHIKTFVLLFVFTVPFAMSESMGWYTPVAAALLAFALFGIDEIGVEIEEPFGTDANDLPLERILATIEQDTEQVVAGDHRAW